MNHLAFRIGDEFWLKQGPGIGIERYCKNSAGATVPCGPYSSVASFISAILPNVYVVAGVILFIILLIGGFILIKSAGQDDPESLKKGQKTVMAALVGFLIIFASYWIMQLIKIITGVDILGGGGL